MRIALARCVHMPTDDFDAPPLVAALEARDHSVRIESWDDPLVRWDAFDAILLRSTWDYFHHLPAFLAWAERVARHARLWNPLPLIRWNTHKFYLRELEQCGMPIAPTEFVARGSPPDLATLLAQRGWQTAVLKPAVSADSFATMRVSADDCAAGQAHLTQHVPARDMLVQRYLPTVVEPGERCLVFLGGEFSHAVRKRSLFLGGRHVGPEGVPVSAAADEIDLARTILATASERTGGDPPLYARVDLLRDERGSPHLLELELVEPSLFFGEQRGSAEQLVRALEARMAIAS